MRFKSFFKIGKAKEKPDRDTAEAGDTRATQVAVLEEQSNDRTKDLEAAKEQLRVLANTAKNSKKDEDAPPQPHGPLGELSVEPKDELVVKETNVGTPLEKAGEAAKVEKVEAGAAAPAEAKKEPIKKEENDSLNNLFGQEEEEENPLANLISSLPDVTTQELLDDLQEIKVIIKEWEKS